MQSLIGEYPGEWDDFCRQWPLTRLESITLDEYTSANGFIDCLQGNVNRIGPFFSEPALCFGICAQSKLNSDGIEEYTFDDKYCWNEKLGDTAENAFDTVKKALVRIAYAASQSNLIAVEEDETFEPVVKWKIAFLYQNRYAPVLPPIFDKKSLARIAGLPTKTPHVELVRSVMKKITKENRLDLFAYTFWFHSIPEIMQTLSLEGLTETDPDYSPGLTVHDWVRLLTQCRDEFERDGLAILRTIAEFGGKASCTILARWFNLPKHQPINAEIIKFGKQVHNITHCPLLNDGYGNNSFGSILFHRFNLNLSKNSIPQLRFLDSTSFLWVMRDELRKAVDIIGLDQLPKISSEYEELASEPEIVDAPMPTQKAKPPYTDDLFKEDLFVDSDTLDDLLALVRVRKNVILQGPPGVGKTFISKRLAYRLMGVKDDERIGFVQFHQSYGYEDFVAGYRPTDQGGFAVRRGVFFEFCRRAQLRPNDPFVFIIDEINRGNLSKILGELLMLIEPSHRGESLPIACDGSSFSVPENVYLIGMMNTADRSLAMIDYALRRRFSFFTLEPGFETENFKGYENGLGKAFSGLIDVIRDLNKAIADDEGLGKGFCLGHSYFSGLETADAASLRRIVTYDILPTLEEYWFDDSNKVKEWRGRLNGAIDG